MSFFVDQDVLLSKPPRGAVLNRAHPLARGLVSCWLFNEGNGLLVNDLCRSYDGTASGIDSINDWVPTPYGTGLNLDGVDAEIGVGDFKELNDVSEFTFHAILSHDVIDSADNILMKYSSVINWWCWRSTSDANGYLRLEFVTGGSSYNRGYEYSTLVSDGEWFSTTVVYRGSGSTIQEKVRHYHNGIEQTTSGSASFPSSSPNFSVPLVISDATGYACWDGGMALVMVYNTALRPEMVYQLAENPWQIIESESAVLTGEAAAMAYYLHSMY